MDRRSYKSTTHFATVRKYRDYRSQMYDKVRQLTIEKKERDTIRYNMGVSRIFHDVGSLVMLYQKRVNKLESQWEGQFRILEPSKSRGIS